MNNTKKLEHTTSYGLLDYFRLLAAFMVVAIHTSPLLSINESADFFLTRILSRLAVPFFFAVSGFFLFKVANNKEGLLRFIKKTSILYIVSILLYLPVNIYMGYFVELRFDELLKDLLFDGTMYHLWYLPAALLGSIISYFLINKLGLGVSLVISMLLYFFGLLGDSYYGLLDSNSNLLALYNLNFNLFDYTRNGIYFAPICFTIGAYVAKGKRLNRRNSLIAFLLTFSCMIVEGVILKNIGFMKHDSMYLFLIPSLYFLLQVLIQANVRSKPSLRTTSTVIYIIHPIMILIVRILARILGLENLLIHNSMIHFILVAFFSYIFALVFTMFLKRMKIIRKSKDETNHEKDREVEPVYELNQEERSEVEPEYELSQGGDGEVESLDSNGKGRAWLEINLNNLKHNKEVLEENLYKGCNLMAVVKANAYGHGAIKVASYLNTIGVNSFAVATIDEGIELRKNGVIGEILILGYTNKERFHDLVDFDLIQTVIDYDYGMLLNSANRNLKVHIKIDTGMHRLGEKVDEVDKISSLFQLENLKVCGIYTHLCVAESSYKDDICFTNQQVEAFYKLLKKLELTGITLPKTHIQSSYGVLNYPNIKGDYARIGIALYGTISSHLDETKLKVDLKPVLSLKARVALVRELYYGESLGYGLTYTACSNRRIAILPIGYADGLPRNLSGTNSYCLLQGRKAPIIGRICMDQLVIDVTDIGEVKVGDIVTLIGKDGNYEITALEVAANSNTITNELLSRLGTRLARTYRLD